MSPPLRVLVVGDDLDFLDSLLRSLAPRSGWARPLHASDPGQAMCLLGRDAIPDVVILDVGSPALHGREILRLVRDDPRFQRTSVVVTGTKHAPGPERQAFLPGEVWIPKPFDCEDLVTAVELARARVAAEDGETTAA